MSALYLLVMLKNNVKLKRLLMHTRQSSNWTLFSSAEQVNP